MIIITCVDDYGGTSFNHRRQSQDRVLRTDILDEVQGHRLWMNGYSAKQFAPEELMHIMVSEDFLNQAENGDYCFAEGVLLAPYENSIEEIILYRWNRTYPADTYLDIPLTESPESHWTMVRRTELVGHSHEKLTKEVYRQ